MSEPGAIRIGRQPVRPRLLSSNSVLLQGPERFVVVDAGGEPDLLRRHLEEIRRLQTDPPRPVCFVQTHVHIDHVAGLTQFGALPAGWPCEIAVHALGRDALRAGDRAATLAELTDRPLAPFRPAGWREWIVEPRSGPATEPDLILPLGGGQVLAAFCTPGHSPDHVCWRAGSELFAGDLLAATAPLVAGIPGWDRDALLASLDRLEALLAAGGIRRVHVGHGRPLDPAAVAEAIARSRREAAELRGIAPVDEQRVRRTAAGAEALFAELEELFDEIARRLGELADRLAQIQENRAADDVRGRDPAREAGDLLEAFAAFKAEADAEGRGTLGVAARAVQTALRVSERLGRGDLEDLLDESFLRYARTRVVDFIQRAKGLAPASDAVGLDLGGRLRMYARQLQERQAGACNLDEVSGGEAAFRRKLVQCLARKPGHGSAELAVAVPAGRLPARLNPVRFFDALTRLIEVQAGRGARRFELRAAPAGNGAVLTLESAGAAWEFGAARAAVWEKVFARGGAAVDFPPAGATAPLEFRFQA